MTADVVERIFKEFKFRTLSKTSSKNQIFKSIINTAFKANIVCSKMLDEKNVTYYINEDFVEVLEPLINICTNYAKTFDKIPPLIFDEEQIECPE